MATKRKPDAADSSPIAQRWELARRLKELRVQHKRSLEDVARELLCSTAKVSRMETGARGIQRRDVRDLCRYYKVPAKVERELMTLAEEASQSGWWSGFRSLDDATAAFVGLESAATHSWTSNTLVIPGLFQTTAYSTILLQHMKPPGEMSGEAQSERVEIRQRRQERVMSGHLQVRAVIDEAALARTVGSVAVMAEQVLRLLERAKLTNVSLHIVPFGAGAHPGLDGSFHYMSFEPGSLADIVVVEGHLGMMLIDKQADTDRYRELFETMTDRYALSPDESRAWLEARYVTLRSAQ